MLAKTSGDVVIISSWRTPICRANRGSLKDAFPEELLPSVFKAIIDRVPNLDPSIIEDVAVGVVLSELGGSKAARMAINHVGYQNRRLSILSIAQHLRPCRQSHPSLPRFEQG
jgi:acetyl-CoA acyltransferase 1